MTDPLQGLRQAISAVDDELLRLAAKRLDLARQVGEYKLLHGLAIKDYEVEKQIIERTKERARQYGIYGEMAESLVKTLIKYSVIRQDELQRPDNSQARGQGKRILIIGAAGQMGRWFAHFFSAQMSGTACTRRTTGISAARRCLRRDFFVRILESNLSTIPISCRHDFRGRSRTIPDRGHKCDGFPF